jgi:hypothetical protein
VDGCACACTVTSTLPPQPQLSTTQHEWFVPLLSAERIVVGCQPSSLLPPPDGGGFTPSLRAHRCDMLTGAPIMK